MQILHVFVFSGGLVRIVAFWNFLCSVGVCIGEGQATQSRRILPPSEEGVPFFFDV